MTLAYGGPPRPGVPLERCERFSREGSRCTNQTRHADGWCRQDGCDGFRRASTSSAPPPVQDTPRPDSAKREPTAADVPSRPALHTSSVKLSAAAIDSYRFHHGGSIDSARQELRDMLGAFAETARLRTAGPYASLAQDGYKLVLNSEFTVMTGYASLHRERTWAQLQAGVASRFPGGKTDAARWALKEPPESRPLHCDPATIEFTRRVLRDYAFRAGLRDRADAEVEVALRCFIATLCTDATAAVRADDTIEVAGGEVRLVLSADQSRVTHALWPRQPEDAGQT